MPPKHAVSAPRASAPSTTRKAGFTPAARFAFSFRTAFTVFAVVNTIAALLFPIQDCDEVFNYWEPVHYLLHGYGKQTWEYSPEYAIRDWLYVALHAIAAKVSGLALQPLWFILPVGANVHELFHGGKIAEFYGLRISLGFLCALCQARFTTAIGRTLNPRVAIFTGLVMTSSTGFFHASPAFLPSSFAMCMGMLGASAFMDWKMSTGGNAFTHGSNVGIMWFGIGAVLGWPFAGALILPFLVEEVIVAAIADDQIGLVWRWLDGTVRVMILVSLQLAINLFFYHKALIVPLNIVLYNVFGDQGKGPDIFGTEPADFYIKNLGLNFNVWLFFALAAAPLLVLQWVFASRNQSKYILMRSLFFVAPFYTWLAIFSSQAHKEERFMYPAYPFLAMNAAISLHAFLSFIGNADRKTLMGKIPPQLKLFVVGTAVLAAVDVGLFRTVGMITAYRAPMKVYNALQKSGAVRSTDTVCYGKEWYRFPSSFFLPNQAHAKFVRSEFDGLLPGDFSEAATGFGFFPGTWLVPPGMNDMNKFDPGKVIDISHCTFLVDSQVPGADPRTLEPNYAASDSWNEVECSEFLDAANTHIVARLLWVPDLVFVPDKFKRRWTKFCLLKRARIS